MALKDMMKGECPSEILSEKGSKVAYYNDVEENHSQVSGIPAAPKCQILEMSSLDNFPETSKKFFNSFKFTSGRTGRAVKNCSFCGQWSLMNAEVLYTKEFGNGYSEISLDTHPMVKPTSLFCHANEK